VRAAGRVALAVACAMGLGCAGSATVERAYGGTVVQGRYVSPEAYAAFLRGAIAEADGHVQEALAAYDEAASRDPSSPEPWARLGELWCRSRGWEGGGAPFVRHALELDPGYAPAWEVEARCLLAAGRQAEAAAAAARAAALDPRADGANVLLARLGTGRSEGAASAREALLALTRTAPDRVVAWEALAAWAQAHGDVASWASALRELVRLAPSRRSAVARGAEELAGLGAIGSARSVAAAAVDAAESPLAADAPLAARLAVDEAIARGGADEVRRRATRARLGLGEVAARALLGGNPALARALASEAASADATARGARLVLAASGGGDVMAAAHDARPGDAVPSAAEVIAFGLALAVAAPSPGALAAIAHEPLVAGDDRTVRPAVELVSRGMLDAGVLPPGGAVELAALAGGPPPDGGPLDPRHEYLALALTHPDAPRAHDLRARLAAVGADDPIVAAASALVDLAAGGAIAAGAPRALLSRDPADPLLAAMALRLAEKTGDADVERRARAVLAALGGRRVGAN
jgi:tetratricopeptide (TPR) repeat protein